MSPVNDVPVLADVETGALAYTENDVAAVVSAAITVSDLDTTTDANLDSATVTIGSGLTDGDVLAYSGSNTDITAAYVSGTGVLTLTGSVLASAWETALRAVTYSSSSEDPTGTQSSADRAVSFVISDGVVSSAAVTRTVTVTPVNDVPVLAAVEAGALAYTENDVATVVSATITVSDLDLTTDANLDTATVTIITGLTDGDVLAYSLVGSGIVASYDAASGELSLSGSGVSQAVWQTALRAVTYSSSSEDPTGTQSSADRVVSFVISDGDCEQRSGDSYGDGDACERCAGARGGGGGSAGVHGERRCDGGERDDHCV